MTTAAQLCAFVVHATKSTVGPPVAIARPRLMTMLFPRPASDPIQVGPYTLTECIGQGGMAVVYKATRQGPGDFEKTVVVKAMLPGLAQKRDLVELFRAEARLMAQLDHPNIVQVHDAGMAGSVPYLVMEYLNGRNLTQLRTALHASGERVPVDAAVAIMRHVCRALGYAHEFTDGDGNRRQIIHRDVSPSNVMVCRDGTVKLLDFGVAKVTGEFDREATRSFRGKYAYMAPEQVLRGPLDRRIDVFAAGIVLHELLTGRRLFACDSELETLERVVRAEVPPPSRDNPDVPRSLDAVVLKALRRDPAARYRNGNEMADALEQCGVRPAGRRALAELMARACPAGYVTCEVCGKMVALGAVCDECGTAAPHEEGAAFDDEPEPLPPPPAVPRGDVSRRGPHLRLVRTVADSAPLELPPPIPEARGARPLPYDIEPASGPVPLPSLAQDDTHETEVRTTKLEPEASSIPTRPTGVDLVPGPMVVVHVHEGSVPTAAAAAQARPVDVAPPTEPPPSVAPRAAAPSPSIAAPIAPAAAIAPPTPIARPATDLSVPSLRTPPRAVAGVIVAVTLLAAAGAIALVLWLGGRTAAAPPSAAVVTAPTLAPSVEAPAPAVPAAAPAPAPPSSVTPTSTKTASSAPVTRTSAPAPAATRPTSASHEATARKRRATPPSSAPSIRAGRLVDPFAGSE
jgi:serine/threonine-protein kinase